jgi:hypothetical protein
VLRGAIVAGVFALVPCIAVYGPAGTVRESLTWARYVAPTLAQGQQRGTPTSLTLGGIDVPQVVPQNLSAPFAVVRASEAMGLWRYRGGNLPPLARWWLTLCAIGGPLLAILLTRRLPPEQQAAWVLVVALMAGPLVRPSYLPAMLPALLVLLKRRAPAVAPVIHPAQESAWHSTEAARSPVP